MTELRNLLAFMDEEDRERVLRRYERIFDAAGEDGEEALIRSLGSPVRQVLDVEREYTRVKAEGKTPFLDADEPAPGEDKDFSALVREAADALKGSDSEKTLFPTAGDADAETADPLPIEELIPPETPGDELPGETVIPDMEESAPEGETAEPEGAPETETVSEEAPEKAMELTPAEAPEAAEAPSAETAGPAEQQTDSEPLTPIYDETEETPAQPAKPAEPESPPEPEESAEPEEPSSPGFGRILAAVVVTIPFLLWWAAGFAVSLALGALILAVGFAVCVAGVYLGGYALSGGMTFMPDRLLLGGAALTCFAAALLLIWMGLWIIVGGMALVIRTSAKVYRRILGRPDTEEDEIDG